MNFPPSYGKGFSLVELMIAMVLGLVIVGGCLSIFTGVVRSSSLNQTISNLQGNARFALDLIGRDVRAAGFIGCSAERDVALNITVNDPPTTNLSRTAVSGYVVGSTAWSPSFPTAYTPATGVGIPVAGTHALSVQYAEYPGLLIEESMFSKSSDVVLANNDEVALHDGQLMVLSDCSSADLFSISSVSKASSTTTVTPGDSLAKRYSAATAVAANTRAMPFVSTIYYIGDTGRTSSAGDKVYSLYAHFYPYGTSNPPMELVEGVDQLVLEFGVRQVNDSLLYVTADDAGYRESGIETVRVGLLLSSLGRYSSVDESRNYTLAGQTVSAKTTVGLDDPVSAVALSELSYTGDKRMRMPFNATFNVRNRNF